MRNLFTLVLIVLSMSLNGQLQLKGFIIDQENEEQLSYVNIGIIGKNIGTVTGRNGGFMLDVPEQHYSDTVRISMIGYEKIEMEVNQLEKQLRKNQLLPLKPVSYEMKEVVISSKGLVAKRVGNLKWKKNVYCGFGEDKLGNEIGIAINLRKKKAILKDVSFVLGRNDVGKVRFRLNVYTIKGGKPAKNLLRDNIILETEARKGIVTTDLTSYNIQLEGNFLLSLEWIEDYPENSINFAATLFSKPIWVRETSQANFIKVPVLGIGLNATILY